jgi:hypothetical protein
VVKDHGDDMCPPRANYTPYGPTDTSL